MDNLILSKVKSGITYKIKDIFMDDITKDRLCDFGIISGSNITPMFYNISNNARAYMINGSLITLRDTDAANISVY